MLLVLALAAVGVAAFLAFGVGRGSPVTPPATLPTTDPARTSGMPSAKLDGSADGLERRSLAEDASTVPAASDATAANAAVVSEPPQPFDEVAYSEPTELLHFALENTDEDFEGKYREQGKDEFTANFRALESVLEAQRSGALDEKSRLDPKQLEILEARVKWMRSFTPKSR
jgi:hypothetical protein